MEPNGSSRRTIALYGGDSAASGFIPGTNRLGGRTGRIEGWASMDQPGPSRDGPRLFTRALLGGTGIAAGFRFPKRAWGERN